MVDNLKSIQQISAEFMEKAMLADAANQKAKQQQLEIKQLQDAMKALSEKLKLFQTIEKDKEAVMKQLRDTESARSDLKK